MAVLLHKTSGGKAQELSSPSDKCLEIWHNQCWCVLYFYYEYAPLLAIPDISISGSAPAWKLNKSSLRERCQNLEVSIFFHE